MKHLAIGPATIVSDADTLTASYTIETRSSGGAPDVPIGSGADQFNSIAVSDGSLILHLQTLGVSSLFLDPREGLMTPASEGRPMIIESWMSVRLTAAAANWLATYPDVMSMDPNTSIRYTYDLIVWLAYWFDYALTTGLSLGPAAFMWSQS